MLIDIYTDIQGQRAGGRRTLQGGTWVYESLKKSSTFDQEFKLIKEDQENVRSFMISVAREPRVARNALSLLSSMSMKTGLLKEGQGNTKHHPFYFYQVWLFTWLLEKERD